jgi:iron complex transport system substrate-binding protein
MMMQTTSASRAWRACAIIAALVFGATASAPAAGVDIRDATGRVVNVSDPSRIVSIGGSVTEILYALGQDKRIVAIDITSLYPVTALKEKPNVGYLRQLSPEGVLGLSPTLVLAAEGAGPKEAVAVVEAASVPFVHVPDRFTGEGIVEKIKLIAAATGQDKQGECLAKSVEADLAAVTKMRAAVTKPARVIFILSFQNGRAMVAGRNTAADGIIRLGGGVNAMADFEGYKIVSDEALIATQPDSILAMERSNFQLTASDVFAHAAFSTSPAAAKKSFTSMDGLYLLGFGPRTAKAARDLAHSLYPSLETAALPSERNASETCRP